MKLEKVKPDYKALIPDIPNARHIPELVHIFQKETDSRITDLRDGLFRVIKARGVKKSSQNYQYGLAAVANWFHRKEKRIFADEPFITHPLAVARIIVDCPYIQPWEIEHNVAKGIGHDLKENAKLTDEQLEEYFKPAHARGISVLSNVIGTRFGTKKLERTEYFKRIFDEGDVADLRVKIADWIHNLRTTPSLLKGILRKNGIK